MYTNQNGEALAFGACGTFRLRSIDTSGLAVTVDTQSALGCHGAVTREILYNPRTIPCKLAVIAKDHTGRHSAAGLREHWQEVMRVLAPHIPGTLRVWDEAGRSWDIDCRPAEVPAPTRKPGAWYNFDVSFVADHPFWRDTVPISTTIDAGTFGIYNDQPQEMTMIARVIGPTDSVRIACGAKRMFINQSIPEGQTLIIDTGRQQITLNGVNASYKLSIDSEYIRLPPGDNTVEVACNQPVELEFYRNYVGV